jgi:putative hemolysin
MQSFRLDTAKPHSHWVRELLGIVVACAILYAGYQHFVHRGSPADHSTEVAAQSGASYCSTSGYELENRLDGSKETIYDCRLGVRMRCLSEHGGITRDITTEVRLLFSDTLGAGKPECIS